MISIEKISSTIKSRLNNRFVRNVGWLGGSDLFVRVSYLATTVTLARNLSRYDYGLAAIAITVHELMQVFTRMGIGAKIIQSDQDNLDELCNSAYWLNWLVFATLFVVQCAGSFVVAKFYRETNLILPICVLALTYLIVPIASIQASLIIKENRLKVTALNNTIQLTFNNILTIILAIYDCGIWSVIVPRVISSPIWVYMYYTNHSWRPTGKFTTKYWGDIFRFGRNVLGVQFLKTFRNYTDYLIVGRFIGVKDLGSYYFAFNAGLGISLSIINAINGALFPHLCASRSDWEKFKAQYFSSLKTIALILIPVVVLQSTLAPYYVPLIFGEKWNVAVPILILICLSAIPRPFADASTQLVTAVGRPDIDLRWNIVFTVLFVGCLLIGVHWGVIGVAIAVLLAHWLFLPLYSLWASRYVFTRLQPKV